jgi:signal transduction histidine kinase
VTLSLLRSLSLFDGLTDEQLADLVESGTEVAIEPGIEHFREGDAADFWWVLIDGALDLVRHIGREDVVVARMDEPGRWAGGFRAWDEQGVYLATGRGARRGRMLRVPASVLHDRAGAWFPFALHLIRGLYATARSIEATARQRESLMALGRLAAELAHEINNPAAAASRAVADLDGACDVLLSSLRRLADGSLTPADLGTLDSLRGEIPPAVVPLGPLALADREDALAEWLADHRIDDDRGIAPALAAAGADIAWCERAASVIPAHALDTGLGWVAATLSVPTLLSDIGDSTRRISDLVAAVRAYSQMDRASMQIIDVTDGLESTLVILDHRLGGVRVQRDYASDVPRIGAYAGELNQVWTQLVINALEAMQGTGTLRLTTRWIDDRVRVEVGDTGPGMSSDVAAHAFDPFFTTKVAGEAAGLGLDIARRIVVERHGGAIAIDSRPHGTILRVQLPQRPPGA